MASREDTDDDVSGLRLDKWLWHARFFKSRSNATDAVAGGRVHVNGERAKPSRDVKIGDGLEISREEQHFEVVVVSIPKRRGPATEARACYEETATSISRREQIRENSRYAAPSPMRRPSKHERKALRGLKGW